MARLTLLLDDALIARLKTLAAQRGQSLDACVEALLSRSVPLAPLSPTQLEEAIPTLDGQLLIETASTLAERGSDAAIRPLLRAYAHGTPSQRPSLLHELRVVLDRYPLLTEAAWDAIRATTPRTAPYVVYQLKLTLGLPCDDDRLRPETFAEGATEPEVLSLVALLRWQRTGEVAKNVALALQQIAQATPLPELRAALPYLRRAWHIRFAHPELLQALKTIEAKTAPWKDLPLPVESETLGSTNNLPRPLSAEQERER